MNLFPRLGKTYISSIGIASLFKQGVLDCVLAIMRPEGCGNFAREIVFFTDGIVKEDDVVILDKDSRDIENYFNKKVIILSYSTVMIIIKRCTRLNQKNLKNQSLNSINGLLIDFYYVMKHKHCVMILYSIGILGFTVISLKDVV